MLVCSLAGAISAIVLNKKAAACIKVSFICATAAALMGVACAIAVLAGETFSIPFLITSNFGTYAFTMDPLSGLFLLIISLLVAIVSIYSIDYQKQYEKEYSSGWMGSFYNLFYLSMIMVVASSNAIIFFIAWEAMSTVSYFLVVYERNKAQARSAGLKYVIMMQVGTVFIMASAAHGFNFADFANIGASMSLDQKNFVFVFLLIGFGMKAGIVPLHVWLPAAYTEAPSNVSALMSGAMKKVAIFILIKAFFGFLGIGTSEIWWGLLVMIIGSLSAIIGVLYANVEKDMKRMLGYSSVENVGIILVGIGASMVFKSLGLNVLSSIAMIASLLHVFNHALFKALLFMGAGSVLQSTGTKHMEHLGGLVKSMPRTSIWFFIGVLSISAIPPFNGFVSEWLMFQSLFSSFTIGLNPVVTTIITIAIAVLALTGGLVIACFVRAFGTSFLALPRTPQAKAAKEAPRSMRLAMAIAGIGCIAAGLLSMFLLPVMDVVSTMVTGTSGLGQGIDLLLTFPAPLESAGMTSPLLLGVAMAVLFPVVFAMSRLVGGKQKESVADTWDCGTPLTPRNEYSATAYSNPINKVFTRIYRHKPRPEMVPSVSPYVFKEKSYTANEKEDLIENKFYIPIVKGFMKAADKLRTLQSGSISKYLIYIFVVLVVLLLFFR
jgi:hydrogenase-4 component B